MSSKLSFETGFAWDDEVADAIDQGTLPDFAMKACDSVPGAKSLAVAPCLATRGPSPIVASVPTRPSSSTSSKTSSPAKVLPTLCWADLERRYGQAQSPKDKKSKLDGSWRKTEQPIIQSTTTGQNPPAQLDAETSSNEDVYETASEGLLASEGHTSSEGATTPEQETTMAEGMTTSKETVASNAPVESIPEMMTTSEEAIEDPNLTNTGHPPVLGRYRKQGPKNKKKNRKPKPEESS